MTAAAAEGPVVVTVGPEPGYPVLIGHHLLDELPGLIGEQARRVAVVHPRALRSTGEGVRAALTEAGYTAVALETPDAEEAKTAEVAAFCWQVLGREGFTRSDVIVGVGGGATTDLAGFVAASWLRGVPVIQVPTTLLGMVDAAVGGKTGINTAEGKNLVGAFHNPSAVLCDLAALVTLPDHDYVAGLAEVVKCGFVADPVILELVTADLAAARSPQAPVAARLVERAVRVKAAVVGRDLRESGVGGAESGGLGREVLNYGHTFGHAVEQVERYRWRHGAAVSVGMVYVAELAATLGRCDPALAGRQRELLAELGLPVSYRAGAWPQLLAAMRRDKKTRGDRLRFVVLEELARPAILDSPDPQALVAAYAAVSGS